MRLLGIDLAAQPRDTAFCSVERGVDAAVVNAPVVGADDEALLDAMAIATWIGIAAPFGWPGAFVNAVAHYLDSAVWPSWAAEPTALLYRETDRFVHRTVKSHRGVVVVPPSVSANWVAASAWRCANLLRLLRERTGYERDRIAVPLWPARPHADEIAPRGVLEVHPSGALAMWGLPHNGYKARGQTSRSAARGRRAALLAALEAETRGWLVLSSDVRAALLAAHPALDALVCALVACAAAAHDTIQPTLDQRGPAQFEGWIHLPDPRSLARLSSRGERLR